MTQNTSIGARDAAENPLYIKMRRRFSYQGTRTIGEAMAQRAIREGYDPYSSAVGRVRRGFDSTIGHSLPETQIKRANSLPKSSSDTIIVRTARSGQSDSSERLRGGEVHRADSLEHTIIRETAKLPSDKSGTVVKRSSLPVGLICIIVMCAALMMILVYSGIQISRLSREVSSLRSEAAELKKTESALEVALEEKNDMTLIESIATNDLGMVKKSAVEHVYIGVYTDDNAEVYESSDNSTLITNLLSAFTESFD